MTAAQPIIDRFHHQQHSLIPVTPNMSSDNESEDLLLDDSSKEEEELVSKFQDEARAQPEGPPSALSAALPPASSMVATKATPAPRSNENFSATSSIGAGAATPASATNEYIAGLRQGYLTEPGQHCPTNPQPGQHCPTNPFTSALFPAGFSPQFFQQMQDFFAKMSQASAAPSASDSNIGASIQPMAYGLAKRGSAGPTYQTPRALSTLPQSSDSNIGAQSIIPASITSKPPDLVNATPATNDSVSDLKSTSDDKSQSGKKIRSSTALSSATLSKLEKEKTRCWHPTLVGPGKLTEKAAVDLINGGKFKTITGNTYVETRDINCCISELRTSVGNIQDVLKHSATKFLTNLGVEILEEHGIVDLTSLGCSSNPWRSVKEKLCFEIFKPVNNENIGLTDSSRMAMFSKIAWLSHTRMHDMHVCMQREVYDRFQILIEVETSKGLINMIRKDVTDAATKAMRRKAYMFGYFPYMQESVDNRKTAAKNLHTTEDKLQHTTVTCVVDELFRRVNLLYVPLKDAKKDANFSCKLETDEGPDLDGDSYQVVPDNIFQSSEVSVFISIFLIQCVTIESFILLSSSFEDSNRQNRSVRETRSSVEKKKGGIAEKKEEKKKKPKAKKEAELVRVSTPERGSLPSELEPSSCKCKMLVGICYRIISNCPYHAKLLAFR